MLRMFREALTSGAMSSSAIDPSALAAVCKAHGSCSSSTSSNSRATYYSEFQARGAGITAMTAKSPCPAVGIGIAPVAVSCFYPALRLRTNLHRLSQQVRAGVSRERLAQPRGRVRSALDARSASSAAWAGAHHSMTRTRRTPRVTGATRCHSQPRHATTSSARARAPRCTRRGSRGSRARARAGRRRSRRRASRGAPRPSGTCRRRGGSRASGSRRSRTR